MDMTELLDAADSSPESWRLEPKWLRDTYKRQISTDTTESLKAADSSRVSLKQKSCDTSEYVGAVCKHDLCAILEHDMLKQDELNVAGVTIATKMMTDGQVCLAMPSSFVQSLVHMLLLADNINISPGVNATEQDGVRDREESPR